MLQIVYHSNFWGHRRWRCSSLLPLALPFRAEAVSALRNNVTVFLPPKLAVKSCAGTGTGCCSEKMAAGLWWQAHNCIFQTALCKWPERTYFLVVWRRCYLWSYHRAICSPNFSTNLVAVQAASKTVTFTRACVWNLYKILLNLHKMVSLRLSHFRYIPYNLQCCFFFLFSPLFFSLLWVLLTYVCRSGGFQKILHWLCLPVRGVH